VYKIFGPGNQYVTVAKQLATQFGVAIDMPAGPSELLLMMRLFLLCGFRFIITSRTWNG
jgi:hypothetical protein